MISNATNRNLPWGKKEKLGFGKNALLQNIKVRRRRGKTENHVLGCDFKAQKELTQGEKKRFKIFNICIYVCEPVWLLLYVLVGK